MREPIPKPPTAFALALGKKLRHLREDIRHLSPEDVERVSKGAVSSSYLRRLEKGISSPTIEILAAVLEALGSSLGLFFEDMIELAPVDAQDRRFQRILQRSLEKHRADTVALMHTLERGLESD